MDNLTGAFPRSRRLTKSSGFSQVFNTDIRSVDSRFLVLAKNNELEFARLGLAISKRNIRTAVRRNRVKRLARECFRKYQSKLSGLDVVVVSRKGINMSKDNEIARSLHTHLEKISRCKNY